MIPGLFKGLFASYLIIIVLNSCTQIDVFEKNTPIPNHLWTKDFAANGSFEIDDTLSSYKIFIVLRHTDSYNYNNIWLSVGLETPGDSMFFQKVNLSLGTDAKGWEGTGMNDIWEVRKPLVAEPRRFIKPGNYKFEVKHVMRDNPLPGIMSAGIRIEKVK